MAIAVFFPCQPVNYVEHMYTQLLEPDQISHRQSMVAKRGLTNRANVHTPKRKSHLKQYRRNPINPAILAAIGHRFIAPPPPPQKKKKKKKN